MSEHDQAIDLMLCMWPQLQLHEMRFLAKMLDSCTNPVKFLGAVYAACPTQEMILASISHAEAETSKVWGPYL